jgi:FkbM family methyltransferase
MSDTTKSIYARFQSLAARKSLQPAFRMARSLVASGMNYQPGHFTRSGELDVLRRIRASGTAVDTIFDVGANVGGWAVAAAEIFPDATIYSFEPASDTFRELEAQAQGRKIVPVRAALSDTPGTRTLYSVPGMDWMSSLEELDLSRLQLEASEHEEVPCLTLDQFSAERGIGSIDILKIDVEGHEFAVLQGATHLLEGSSVGYVQFEMGVANLDTRTFLRDFVNLLEPGHPVYRILRDGLGRLNYSVKEESFSEANFFAVAKDRPVP